jgi:antitoxin CptB
MKELDVLTERYYAQRFGVAPVSERTAFVRLLEQVEDPDLWAWVMSYSPVPEEYRDVVDELRRHR